MSVLEGEREPQTNVGTPGRESLNLGSGFEGDLDQGQWEIEREQGERVCQTSVGTPWRESLRMGSTFERETYECSSDKGYYCVGDDLCSDPRD